MAIEDIYAMLDALEDVDTADIKESIGSEFDIVSSGANAKVEELIAENAALKEEIKDIKARNYELMTAVTTNIDNGNDSGEEDPEILAVDDLFKED